MENLVDIGNIRKIPTYESRLCVGCNSVFNRPNTNYCSEKCRSEYFVAPTDKKCCGCNVLLVVGKNWTRRLAYRSMMRCVDCGKKKSKRWYKKNRDSFIKRVKEKRKIIRNEVLFEYGGKCTCCSESNPRFLTIEHIGGWGKKHRREVGTGSIYTWLKKKNYPKDKFTILCFNCNLGSYQNNWICPHKENP